MCHLRSIGPSRLTGRVVRILAVPSNSYHVSRRALLQAHRPPLRLRSVNSSADAARAARSAIAADDWRPNYYTSV